MVGNIIFPRHSTLSLFSVYVVLHHPLVRPRDDDFYEDSSCADAPQTPHHVHQTPDYNPERISVLGNATSSSQLNLTRATFVPRKLNDGLISTARLVLPHEKASKLDSLSHDSSTSLSTVKANIGLSIATQGTPDQRIPRMAFSKPQGLSRCRSCPGMIHKPRTFERDVHRWIPCKFVA